MRAMNDTINIILSNRVRVIKGVITPYTIKPPQTNCRGLVTDSRVSIYQKHSELLHHPVEHNEKRSDDSNVHPLRRNISF